jgi:GR25 family glycosyltransferase involved in LPS biosynthesis
MILGADSVYVINLERHKVRRRRTEQMFKRLNLSGINYIEAVDKIKFGKNPYKDSKPFFGEHFWDPNGYLTLGILACALSHRKAYKAFLDSGDEVGLFLEDDVKNTQFIYQLDFTKLREELDSIEDWGVAIYGRYEKDILRGKPITDYFYKSLPLLEQYSGHAYLLNRKSAQWFYDNTEKIRYAADIRLEISPFNVITLDQSIFVQRKVDWDKYGEQIGNCKDSRYDHLREFNSTTMAEAFNREHHKSYEGEKVLISKYVPAVSYKREEINIRGKQVRGFKIKIGDKNKVFNPRK